MVNIHAVANSLMANLNKKSVREEVDKQLKSEFVNLYEAGKVTDEVIVLVNSMLMIMELILSIFLERTTKKINKNSSIPSPQTGKGDSMLGSPGSNGKGKSENNTVAGNVRTVETVTIIKLIPALPVVRTSEKLPRTNMSGVPR
jgi:hypothetical protein